jgi:hypothetical protein
MKALLWRKKQMQWINKHYHELMKALQTNKLTMRLQQIDINITSEKAIKHDTNKWKHCKQKVTNEKITNKTQAFMSKWLTRHLSLSCWRATKETTKEATILKSCVNGSNFEFTIIG